MSTDAAHADPAAAGEIEEVQKPFVLPELLSTGDMWGPPASADLGFDAPFSIYSKGERLVRLANWIEDKIVKGKGGKGKGATGAKGGQGGGGNFGSRGWGQRGGWGGEGGEGGEKPDRPGIDEEEKEWETANYDKGQAAPRRYTARGRGKGASMPRRQPGGGRGRGDKQKKKVDLRLGQLRYQHVHRLASVEPKSSWTALSSFNLPDLAKMNDLPTPSAPTDLRMCGDAFFYNNQFDRVAPRAPIALKDFQHKTFYSELASEDVNLREFAKKAPADQISIVATDIVLATLMAAPRSVMPWDIVIHRIGNLYFLDRREESTLELWTVNETANEPPPEDNKEEKTPEQRINCAPLLAEEATVVSQAFGQQVLNPSQKYRPQHLQKHPFAEDDEDPASMVYRYRQWQVRPGDNFVNGMDFNVIARCQADGCAGKGGSFMRAFALNEYQHGLSSWKTKLQTSQGAVMATEIKNNACKLAKWTCLSILGGCDIMKLGFVTRTNPAQREHHQILQVLQYPPRVFAQQIGLDQRNMWNVLQHIVKDVTKHRNESRSQQFVLLKDPNKSILRLYSVPDDEFDSGSDDSSSDS